MNAQRRQWLRSAGGRKGFLMRRTQDFLNRLKRLAASFCVLPVLAAAASDAAGAPCSGRIINPITDVCWSCLFPITLGTGIPLSAKGGLPDVSTDANAICTCGSNANLSAGLNMGFWEPLRTAEIVRHPFCFPSLGGIEMKGAGDAVRASSHGRTARTDGNHRRTSFYQIHWYQTPWLFVLEALLDNGCLEQAPWDLAYLSELDPLWDDTLASFLLAPDAALFTAGAAFGACAVDCTLATAGLPSNELYWCSGCQGRVFPLSGWMAGQVSELQARHLMAHRFAVKLSREGILWSAHGKRGQCGPYVKPILEKAVWRTQLVHPSRSTAKTDGACCWPLGRSTAIWGASKTFPATGEDGAILLWRRRDCCMTKTIDASGLSGLSALSGHAGLSAPAVTP